jgi:antitoxin component YwqK of YwqJK toxin-antitoxin module
VKKYFLILFASCICSLTYSECIPGLDIDSSDYESKEWAEVRLKLIITKKGSNIPYTGSTSCYVGGELTTYEVYEEGRLIEDRIYWNSNQIMSQDFYKDGRLHGTSSMWDEDGSILYKTTYVDGKEIDFIFE